LDFLNEHQNKARKVLDFSGATKTSALNKEPDTTYALGALYDPDAKIVSFPGCSSWGVLAVLLSLKDILPEVVFADVKFSKSALQHDSPNDPARDLLKPIHPLCH